jgi:glyoxylate utilization-related uncharacterized protein
VIFPLETKLILRHDCWCWPNWNSYNFPNEVMNLMKTSFDGSTTSNRLTAKVLYIVVGEIDSKLSTKSILFDNQSIAFINYSSHRQFCGEVITKLRFH